MASTDTANGAVSKPVNSHSLKQDLRARVEGFIKSKFAATLGKEFDIVNVFMALLHKESRFNAVDSKGPSYDRSHLSRISKYSAISKFLNEGSALSRSNIINSAAAYGLAQVTGYYIIKGCGPNGKSEIERLRPDLAEQLTVDPGVDVSTKLHGIENIDNQILTGLIVLEGKLKEVAPKLVANGTYSNKLTAAVASYLGLGKSDSLGSTPERYANSIIRGSSYQIANNGRGPDGALLAASGTGANSSVGSPSATSASGSKLSTPGC